MVPTLGFRYSCQIYRYLYLVFPCIYQWVFCLLTSAFTECPGPGDYSTGSAWSSDTEQISSLSWWNHLSLSLSLQRQIDDLKSANAGEFSAAISRLTFVFVYIVDGCLLFLQLCLNGGMILRRDAPEIKRSLIK